MTVAAQQIPIEPMANTFADLMGRVFRVPRYQRAYDWDDEQVGDFIGDILRLYEARRSGDSSAWHFFGALVTINHVDVGFVQGNWFEVVDGQQRLATLVMTLAELKRALEAAEVSARPVDADAADEAAKQAAELATALEEHGQARLTLSKRDQQYFAEIVAGSAVAPKKGSDEAHLKLYDAKSRLLADLIEPVRADASSESDRVERLSTLRSAIFEGGFVVHLYTDDRQQAYRLFSVLNDRGRPLGVGALLRTHTLSILEGYPAHQDEAEIQWDAILREGESWVDGFLGSYYASHAGARVTKGEMYDAFLALFKNELPNAVGDEGQADKTRDFTKRLREESIVYGKLQDGEWPYEQGKAADWDRDRLERLLKILHHTLALPLLLASQWQLCTWSTPLQRPATWS